MHVSSGKSIALVVAAGIATFLAAPRLVAGATAAEEATSILEQSGVQGGIIVHLGCGAGRLTKALKAGDAFRVHGLDTDPANVEATRQAIRAAGLYGPVAADRLAGGVLPYTDNLVNLLVADELGDVPIEEVLRVLVPEGVALVGPAGARKKIVKPRPEALDDWTHYLYDASGNAVSHDTAVDFLRQMQWIGGPRYSRHHDHMSAASAMVASGGRLFYIFDHASPMSIQLPSQWELVARDAFNGTILWRRPIQNSYSQLQRLKSGPADLPRRLVAIGDTVYATLALDAPVEALDGATGKTLRVFEQTKGTDEILYRDGVLYLVINREGYDPAPFQAWTPEKRTIMAIRAETGETLWEVEWPWVTVGSMAVGGGRVVFYDGERIVALDRQTGSELWRSEVVGDRSPIPVYFSPCLVLHKDLVFFSGSTPETKPYHADNGKVMYALAADTGETLWTAPHAPAGYRSAEDIFVIDDLVWTSDNFNSKEFKTPQTGTVWGRDLYTGEVQVEFMPDVDTHWFHHRCYRAKATENYILMSRTGIEFVDFRSEHWTCHHWVRSACLYGIMPANGMIYNAPHPCACYLEAKLDGFNALSPLSEVRQQIIDAAKAGPRLERGPAYSTQALEEPASPADWPTFRSDAARSGHVAARVPTDLALEFRTKIGGKLTQPVVAAGRLYVAQVDQHTVHAVDAASGEPLWSYTAGARVDSPPTIWRQRVLFGSADGYVYCLRADSGELMWRYRAAPADLRMGAHDQLESVWPVHGSVLIRPGASGRPELWCVAGRSMYLDGGLRLVRLDPVTGQRIAEKLLDDRVPRGEDNLQVALKGLNMPVALSDILVSQGDRVFMKSQEFDLEGNRIAIETPNLPQREQKGETAHLFSPTGLLDDVWWHRSYWLYGRVWKSGAGGYFLAGRFATAGRPMVFNEEHVFSFGRKPEFYRWTTPMEYMLYRTVRQPEVLKTGQKKKPGFNAGAPPTEVVSTQWRNDIPILARAMVLADDRVFVAGPPDLIDEPRTLKTFETPATQALLERQAAALDGAEGALLWAVSAADGAKLVEQGLPEAPVFDGMIAAGCRLYYSTTEGNVIALGGKP